MLLSGDLCCSCNKASVERAANSLLFHSFRTDRVFESIINMQCTAVIGMENIRAVCTCEKAHKSYTRDNDSITLLHQVVKSQYQVTKDAATHHRALESQRSRPCTSLQPSKRYPLHD